MCEKKKNICKFEDYLEPRTPQLNILSTCNSLNRSLAEFKLDRIFPKNINVKLTIDRKENSGRYEKGASSKSSLHAKGLNNYDNRFYQEYISLKEEHSKQKIRKSKISHIFNIRSINLLDKAKLEP
jgi:hypothetical protein